MKRTLILAEKPKVARKIASYLFSSYETKTYFRKVKYYVARQGSREYIVASALGHLFTLTTDSRGIPAFDYRWERIDKVERGKRLHGLYINFFLSLRNRIHEIIIATDYDIEGELIAYNIVRFCLGLEKPIKRMKFSEITPRAIRSAFENLLEFQPYMALAGETRHVVDWLFGINLSRLLQRKFRKSRLSAGRVQTPTLKLVYDRELEILNFKPEIYYKVVLKLGDLELASKQLAKIKPEELSRISKLLEPRNIECQASIEFLGRREILPPVPFNLSELQSEAWKVYKLSPAKTLKLAQSLYEQGYISYPRTDSQRYPEHLNFQEILGNLGKLAKYREAVKEILARWPVKPREGSKTDPAHPCIYPTGMLPGKQLKPDEAKVYHLIVRRFLATFLGPMVLRSYRISVTHKGYIFEKTVYSIEDEGWHKVYPSSLGLSIVSDPETYSKLSKCQIKLVKEKTKPPARYTPSSLVKTMEALRIGTKSTRAEIVEKLYRRKYITGKRIKLTELGKKVVEFFLEFYPKITSIEMTRELEADLEAIEQGTKTPEEIISKSIKILSELLSRREG